MAPESLTPRTKERLGCLGILLVLVTLLIVGPKFFEVSTDRNYRNVAAKAGATQLASGLRSYYDEYGHWPDFAGDGKILDATGNAAILRVLTAHDETNNPRRIVFFEAAPARKPDLTNGITPDGVFVDPWGSPYRIILDSGGSGTIANPYPKDPNSKIQARAIVWSLGKDGKQGAPKDEHISQGSDDICSWK